MSAQAFINTVLTMPKSLPEPEISNEPVKYFSPQKYEKKEVPSITLKKGTVSVAEGFTVDVIDASKFLQVKKPHA